MWKWKVSKIRYNFFITRTHISKYVSKNIKLNYKKQCSILTCFSNLNKINLHYYVDTLNFSGVIMYLEYSLCQCGG